MSSDADRYRGMEDATAELQQRLGICGLYNYGNTCYMNSALQLLRAIPEWAAICESEEPASQVKEKVATLYNAYASLTNKMNATKQPARCHPKNFIAAIRDAVEGTPWSEFSQGVPHDAHEFIMYLCDQLGMALHREPSMTAQEPEGWYAAVKADYSPILDITTGLEKVTCTCLICGTAVNRWETFNMLKIPVHGINPETTVVDRLYEERGKPIIVDGYDCDTCRAAKSDDPDKKVKIERTICRLPRILFLTLDRFADPSRKMNGVIAADALREVSIVPVAAASTAAQQHPSLSYKYSPIGIIDHHGSLFGGHYNCQVSTPIGNWYMYDDEYVAPLPDGPQFGHSTYIICMRARPV
jgi:ubiquitin C-terminal hydrolase